MKTIPLSTPLAQHLPIFECINHQYPYASIRWNTTQFPQYENKTLLFSLQLPRILRKDVLVATFRCKFKEGEMIWNTQAAFKEPSEHKRRWAYWAVTTEKNPNDTSEGFTTFTDNRNYFTILPRYHQTDAIAHSITPYEYSDRFPPNPDAQYSETERGLDTAKSRLEPVSVLEPLALHRDSRNSPNLVPYTELLREPPCSPRSIAICSASIAPMIISTMTIEDCQPSLTTTCTTLDPTTVLEDLKTPTPTTVQMICNLPTPVKEVPKDKPYLPPKATLTQAVVPTVAKIMGRSSQPIRQSLHPSHYYLKPLLICGMVFIGVVMIIVAILCFRRRPRTQRRAETLKKWKDDASTRSSKMLYNSQRGSHAANSLYDNYAIRRDFSGAPADSHSDQPLTRPVSYTPPSQYDHDIDRREPYEYVDQPYVNHHQYEQQEQQPYIPPGDPDYRSNEANYEIHPTIPAISTSPYNTSYYNHLSLPRQQYSGTNTPQYPMNMSTGNRSQDHASVLQPRPDVLHNGSIQSFIAYQDEHRPISSSRNVTPRVLTPVDPLLRTTTPAMNSYHQPTGDYHDYIGETTSYRQDSPFYSTQSRSAIRSYHGSGFEGRGDEDNDFLGFPSSRTDQFDALDHQNARHDPRIEAWHNDWRNRM